MYNSDSPSGCSPFNSIHGDSSPMEKKYKDVNVPLHTITYGVGCGFFSTYCLQTENKLAENVKAKSNMGNSDHEMLRVQDPKWRKKGQQQDKDVGLWKSRLRQTQRTGKQDSLGRV